MTSTGLEVAAIDMARVPQATELLRLCGLETSDLAPERSLFLAATRSEEILGVIGLEVLGDVGLVRSMAVVNDARGKGIARQLYNALEAEALIRGLCDLYALTETAERFFERAGYVRISRDQTPPQVASTTQFSALCPVSAAVMHLPLQKKSLAS